MCEWRNYPARGLGPTLRAPPKPCPTDVIRCRRAQRRVSVSAPSCLFLEEDVAVLGAGSEGSPMGNVLVVVTRRPAPSAQAPGRRGWGHVSVRAIRLEVAARFVFSVWFSLPSGSSWYQQWRVCAGPFPAALGCRAEPNGCWRCDRSSPRRRSALASSSLPGTLRQPWYYYRSLVF